MVWRIVTYAVAAAIVIGAGTVGYFYYFEPPLVKTSTAMRAPVSEVVYGTGTVEPVRWAKIVPLQRKRLIDLCLCEGQPVKKGDILGRQDGAEEQAMLRELQIRNDQLSRDFDRAVKDYKDDKISESERDRRETALKESNTRITAQKERLESLVLRAPMDGMVLRRDGEIGEIVGPTDVLFWVGPPMPTQVVAEINEDEITKIALGQKALLRSDAFSEALPANVSQITPKGDPKRKTFRVYLRLPPNTPLRIGMTVEANIVVREKEGAIVVPTEALVGNTVQVVSGGKVRRTQVTVGIRGTRYVEVSGNIAQGTAVLSPARIDLADGTSVGLEHPVQQTASLPTSSPANEKETTTTDKQASTGQNFNEREDGLIDAAMSAHILSVVSDARRNVRQYVRR